MRQLFSGLRLRLLMLVVLASVPPVALTLHTARGDRQRQIEDWKTNSLDVIQLATREEDELIRGVRQLLQMVAESSQVKAGRWGKSHQLLLKFLEDNKARYANLGVINTNGEVMASAVSLSRTVDVADRKFFQSALFTRDLSIGDYQVGRITGRPTINFGFPVLGQTGQVQSVVFAALDLKELNRYEEAIQMVLPKGATWTKVDLNGKILVCPERTNWIGETFPGWSRLHTVLSAHTNGFVEAMDEVNPTFYTFGFTRSPLVAGDVVKIVSIPRQVLFAEPDLVMNRNLTLLGVAGGLVLLFGWIGSRFLVLRPIRALVKSSARLGSGDLGVRTGLPHGRDELGQLTRAFDLMANALEQRELKRRQAEETLQTRESMIRELPLLPAAVCVCGRSGTIDLYNKTAVELWGYEPADQFASKRFCGSYALYHPDGTLMPHDQSPMADVLRSGEPVKNRELVIERPDGTRISALVSVVPIRATRGGEMIGAVSCLQDITERKFAEEKIREYGQSLQVLSHRLVKAQETERRHIARELHDEIGQTLTVAEINLQGALRSPGGSSLVPRLEASAEAVARVLEQVRDLSLNLRPSMLDDLGLESALRWYTNRQALLTNLHVTFRADSLANRLDPIIETQCFRVAQEALTNVVRHSHARSVAVDLEAEDGHLHLLVRDDGVGFDVASFRERAMRGTSLGLLSMEERALLAGGRLEFKCVPGQGTEVHAWFPLKWQLPLN